MSKTGSYKSQFVEPSKNVSIGNDYKMVCLSESAHRKLRMVVCAIHEPGVTMSAYLDVVLMKHFSDYQEDISAMLEEVFNSAKIEED